MCSIYFRFGLQNIKLYISFFVSLGFQCSQMLTVPQHRKTTTALATARQLSGSLCDGIRFVSQRLEFDGDETGFMDSI
ncbi:hypothetical protein CsatA_026093 [Cannabis sativa]